MWTNRVPESGLPIERVIVYVETGRLGVAEIAPPRSRSVYRHRRGSTSASGLLATYPELTPGVSPDGGSLWPEPTSPEISRVETRCAAGVAPKLVGAVRGIMNTMSEVEESRAVLDDLVQRIAERFSPDKIILFGSRARGDAGPDSDIDLLVLFSDVADPNQRAAELYASLVDFPSPMDIVVSTSFRFERYRNVVNTVYWPASREGRILYERAA